MTNIAICDDGADDVRVIRNFIEEYMEQNDLPYEIQIFTSGEELLGSHDKYDILFLDIAMGGINGIEAGKKIRNFDHQVKIIYITNFEYYWMQAVNGVHAFAYLKKPIRKEDAEKQMEEALCSIQDKKKEALSVRFEIIHITREQTIETEFRDFYVDDIFYFEYVNRRIRIKTDDGDYYFINQMKDVIRKMERYNFESCHQSYLVNLKNVQKIKGYDVYLKNGEKLPVSQKKSAVFREKLNKFIQESI